MTCQSTSSATEDPSTPCLQSPACCYQVPVSLTRPWSSHCLEFLSGHFFHLGAATSASRKGILDHLIEQAYQLYIHATILTTTIPNTTSSGYLLRGSAWELLPVPSKAQYMISPWLLVPNLNEDVVPGSETDH